ncbi:MULTISPECIES: OmpA family protein [Trichocoleus]|uniref:OmpA family protein n=1 Tax=Trichocoleus desertorum GB2-A4 TaxID=2933944 RepID=A0ABV0J7C7_9CYAN|nr:OmpA family protein [Trichocoleus sp. FACHB-46]MBD1862636.1 OmpA family protein [Trichocoleus sp. FACHB-46]
MPASYRFQSAALLGLWVGLTEIAIAPSVTAAPSSETNPSPAPHLRVVVNSNQDGPIQPDTAITLREAIALTNGTLERDRLSTEEQAQVTALSADAPSRIEFSLPAEQTTIRLTSVLPPLARPGLVIDGSTQPGYDAEKSATAEISIPIPVVAITPAEGQEVFRGLTVVADNVTIRGLSLYGFNSRRQVPASTPPADIFIAHRLPPPDTSQQQPPNANFPFGAEDKPPQNVTIENNWLGLTINEQMPTNPSAFGVSVFNGVGTVIRRNRIANHEGSGIITAVRAENTQVTENIIVGNGIAGMPDAIRLEGVIDRSQITANLICGNDGSGIYLFKPDGSVQIQANQIKLNGRRLRRAAVYLMGNQHQVIKNQISYQTGPGVVVTSYPKSDRNLIQDNEFAALEGLSIDLNTQQNVGVQDYQRGDGPNPPRNSGNRRLDTGNSAINAPQWLSSEFVLLNDQVNVDGKADPGTQVEIYRVEARSQESGVKSKAINLFPGYAPLSKAIATATANEKGRFSATLTNVQPGEQISAIATDSRYGTSEPAANATIRTTQGAAAPPTSPTPVTEVPRCTTPPVAQVPPTPPVEPTPTPPPIRLRVPRNIHFALDKDIVSPESAAVLNQIAEVLREYPFIVVDIEGHTDPRASDAYNLDLGRRRALAARNYLLRRGVAPERLTIRSLGETQRKTTGASRVDYARDRRAEFTFQDIRGVDIIFESQEEDLQIEPGGSR